VKIGGPFYVLQGRVLVQAGDRGYDLGPGASISMPAGTPNTFTVLTPSAKFLVISQTGAMGGSSPTWTASRPATRPHCRRSPAATA
jgi:quercetin dioxygenase-like cupin family protein